MVGHVEHPGHNQPGGLNASRVVAQRIVDIDAFFIGVHFHEAENFIVNDAVTHDLCGHQLIQTWPDSGFIYLIFFHNISPALNWMYHGF